MSTVNATKRPTATHATTWRCTWATSKAPRPNSIQGTTAASGPRTPIPAASARHAAGRATLVTPASSSTAATATAATMPRTLRDTLT